MGSVRLLDRLLPPACPVCDRLGPAPCPACWSLLRPAPSGPSPPGIDRCRSLLAYEGAGRELIARLKYRNARSTLAWLADGMADLTSFWVPQRIDAVTWAPTTPDRRRQRGFDQAELLARAVAARLGLPCVALLRRRPGPPQTGRSRDERHRGPTFTVVPTSRFVPAAVSAPARSRGALTEAASSGAATLVLVDDLLTTGATLAAAARALRPAGAATIHAVTAGRTPLKVLRPPADA